MNIIKCTYHIEDDSKKRKILNQNFVSKNMHKYKINYRNKIYPLTSEFKITNESKRSFDIKFINYTKNQIINEKIKEYKPIYRYNESELFNKNNKRYKLLEKLATSINEKLKMVYKIETNEENLRIFGNEFVQNNKDKCIILYSNKLIPLQSHLLIKDIDKLDIDNRKLELFLVELEDNLDKSFMFSNCNLLEKIVSYNDNQIMKIEMK